MTGSEIDLAFEFPQALGLLYCNHAAVAPWPRRATDWKPAASAQRFEPGSPNLLGIHALEASLALLEQVGPDAVESRVLENTAWLRSLVAARPEIQLLGPDVASRWSGIVSFRPLYASAEDWVNHLRKRGICCAARSGAVRLSPHFYTKMNAMEVVLHT